MNDGPMQASAVGGPPPREGAHDATTAAALDRLAGTLRGDPWFLGDDRTARDIVRRADLALALGLAKRAGELDALVQQMKAGIMDNAKVQVHEKRELADALKAALRRVDELERALAALALALGLALRVAELEGVAGLFAEIECWQRATFPHATAASVLEHLRREFAELQADPSDREEMADVAFLLIALADVQGDDLLAAIREKFAVNLAREWNPPDESGVVEHVRAASGGGARGADGAGE